MGLSVLGLKDNFFSLHQVLICETGILLQLRQFWDIIQNKLAYKNLYIARNEGMRMRLLELQDDDKKVKKLSLEGLSEVKKDIKEVFHYQDLSYSPKIICLKLISKH